VGKAYAAGDPLAREILRETAEVLTVWLGNIVDLLDPDVVVMGGGVAAMLEPFFEDIKTGLPAWCVNPRASEIPLVMAHYGADAGIAGAAALCSEDQPKPLHERPTRNNSIARDQPQPTTEDIE